MTVRDFFDITSGLHQFFESPIETETNGSVGYIRFRYLGKIEILPERKTGCKKFETIAELRKLLVNELPQTKLSVDHIRLVNPYTPDREAHWQIYERDYSK